MEVVVEPDDVAGHDADAPNLRRARDLIRSLGGAARCNSFTKCYLALLGQYTASDFALSSDGQHGTVITGSAAADPIQAALAPPVHA